MLRRKIYDELVEWKRNSNGKTAIMINGARRVGKSYIAQEFASNEYRSYILVDFVRAPKAVKDLFKNDTYGTVNLILVQNYSSSLPAN